MADDEAGSELRKQLLTLRIILGALLGGVGFFTIVAISVPPPATPPGGPVSLTTLALCLGGSQLVARSIVSNVMLKIGRRRIAAEVDSDSDTGDVGPLFMLFRTTKIVSSALLESAAFFMLIAYMQERSAPALYGAGIMTVAMLFELLSVSQFESWLNRQLRLVEEERQLRI